MPDQIYWTPGMSNDTILLTDHDAGYIVTPDGTRGLSSPSWAVSTDEFAGIDGATITSMKATPRTITLGMHVRAKNEQDHRNRMRGLVKAMRPRTGLGTLEVATPWGDRRSIGAICTGGLEGDESLDVSVQGRWFKAALTFLAPDPWFTGRSRTVDIGLGGAPNFFPFFPLTLAPSAVAGSFHIDLSDADAPAWPEWVIYGPGSDLLLRNATTGHEIRISGPIAAGSGIYIVTAPGKQSVRDAFTGANLMSRLETNPSFFPLIEDLNVIEVSLPGATSQSRVTAWFRPRYAGV